MEDVNQIQEGKPVKVPSTGMILASRGHSWPIEDKAFREWQHPSAPRSVNEQPIHGPTVWKLYEFHIDPLLGWFICHALWPKVNHIVHPTSYQTHIPFTSNSWDTAISIFYLENPMSKSLVGLKVTTWVQHSIDSHPFHSRSFCHPIPEIWLLQNRTVKHWWYQCSGETFSNIIYIDLIPSR